MKKENFENAVDTLSVLVSGLGAGIGVWGIINLIEAYEQEAEFEQLTEEYRHRISEINVLLEQLYTDNATGKVHGARFQKLSTQYEAEQIECYEAIAELKADIAEQKKQGLEQLLSGADIAGIAPLIGSEENMRTMLEAIKKNRHATT